MVNLDPAYSSSAITSPLTPNNGISLNKKIRDDLPREMDMLNNGSVNKWGVDNLFTSENNDNPLPNGKSFIEHIFEKYDDDHAMYSIDYESDRYACQYEPSSSIQKTPVSIFRKKCVTSETKSIKKLAIMEGRKDFCEILEHAGINSSTYLAGVFSSTKKKRKPLFGCSTPIVDNRQILSLSNRNNSIHLNSFQFLMSPLNASWNSTSSLNSPVVTPSNNWNYNSNCKNFPDQENLKTILLGITCFVDVRSGKENRSEICKEELLAIGAKVEKKFTKKVTHVIFKEAKMSTYVKAKKLAIPIVSVMWIEACKLAKGPVDPQLYPPTKMEKYEEDSPFTQRMKKKINRLNLNKKELRGGSLRLSSPTVRKSSKRKAVTEIKQKRTQHRGQTNKERQCNKKLNFIDIDRLKTFDNDKDLMPIDLDASNKLTESGIIDRFKIDITPRKMTLLDTVEKKKKCKLKSTNDCGLKQTNKKRKRTRSKSSLDSSKTDIIAENKDFNNLIVSIEKCDTHKDVTQNELKRRKLFNPNHFTLSEDVQLDVDITSPYPESPLQKKHGPCQYGPDKVSKVTAEINFNLVDESSNLKFCKKEEHNSTKTRNSLSLFVQNNERIVSNRVRYKPTIVFTSIHRSETSKLSLIVKKLGTFEVEDQVSEKTSHVITSSQRRTINLLRGITRGCWILRNDWLLESELASKWLAEEHFELKTFYPAVMESRLQRQAFKKTFQTDLFSSCGSIFVTQNTKPPPTELIELIKLCRGKVVTCARGANIIIGERSASDKCNVRVRENWVLDSITRYKLLDINKYLITNSI